MLPHGIHVMHLVKQVFHSRLTAFALKTLGEARYGEWEQNLFINIELLNKIAQFLCAQQNTSGAWYPEGPIYDRKYVSIVNIIIKKFRTDLAADPRTCDWTNTNFPRLFTNQRH